MREVASGDGASGGDDTVRDGVAAVADADAEGGGDTYVAEGVDVFEEGGDDNLRDIDNPVGADELSEAERKCLGGDDLRGGGGGEPGVFGDSASRQGDRACAKVFGIRLEDRDGADRGNGGKGGFRGAVGDSIFGGQAGG